MLMGLDLSEPFGSIYEAMGQNLRPTAAYLRLMKVTLRLMWANLGLMGGNLRLCEQF